MEVVHGSAAIGSHRAWSAWSIISSGTILRPLSSARTLWDLLILILIAYSVVRALAAPRAYNTGYWRRLPRGLPPGRPWAPPRHAVGSPPARTCLSATLGRLWLPLGRVRCEGLGRCDAVWRSAALQASVKFRLRSPLPHLHRDWARSFPHLHRDWARSFPHLRRDCAGTVVQASVPFRVAFVVFPTGIDRAVRHAA